MNILHICNDFLGSKVHRNLYQSLERKGVRSQLVFVPLRKRDIDGLNRVVGNNIKVVYSDLLKKRHRALFDKKVDFLYKSLKEQIELGAIDLVHATTLFSDGAVALKIFEEFRIPFVATVRATDVSMFLRYRPDLILILARILKHASQVIFVSDSLKNRFFRHYLIRMIRPELKDKCAVIYNGLDQYWLQNLNLSRRRETPLNFLYVGSFIRRKNVIRLIDSFVEVNKRYDRQLRLSIVGGKGKDEEKIQQLALKHSEEINLIGAVHDKDMLKDIYRENDVFVMVSFAETFGLVYLEALSQGLPVIHTKDQGIDGVFKKTVGVSVNARSCKSIEEGIVDIINNYKHIQLNSSDFVEFDWLNIAAKYKLIYRNAALGNKK